MFIPVRSLSEGIYCTAVSAAYDWICVTHVFNITIMRAESPGFQSSAVFRTNATRINQAENDDFVISNKKQTNKYRRAISDFCVCALARTSELKQNVCRVMFQVRITFSCSDVHDMTNSAAEIPEVEAQLSQWRVTLHLYV